MAGMLVSFGTALGRCRRWETREKRVLCKRIPGVQGWDQNNMQHDDVISLWRGPHLLAERGFVYLSTESDKAEGPYFSALSRELSEKSINEQRKYWAVSTYRESLLWQTKIEWMFFQPKKMMNFLFFLGASTEDSVFVPPENRWLGCFFPLKHRVGRFLAITEVLVWFLQARAILSPERSAPNLFWYTNYLHETYSSLGNFGQTKDCVVQR